MKIELSKEEADALLKLVDMAVRSGGLQVAEASLFFTRKISEAVRAEATPIELPEDKPVKGKPNGSAGRDDRAAAARP